MQIATLAYDHIIALDAVGPHEILSRIPGVEAVVVGERRGPVRSDTGALRLIAEAALDEVRAADVVIVPGWAGAPRPQLLGPGPIQDWLREADACSTWTASVGTGAIVLAAAGLLLRRRATTHWLAVDWLGALGAVATPERVVRDGKYLTAAGTTAGIDMALILTASLDSPRTAQALQLLLEYDPAPPFASGAPAQAPQQIVSAMRAVRSFIFPGRSPAPNSTADLPDGVPRAGTADLRGRSQ